MNKYKLINNITGWIVFAVATVVYLLTVEPTASFWDCGEFITSAYKLEVGHPPGAPFFMLVGNLFTQFAGDPSRVALMINSMSALMSAFTILFLFWTITHLTRKLLLSSGSKLLSKGQIIAVIGSGLVGSLVYTFSDTFWFSAVEGEVYAFLHAHRACLLADPQVGRQCRQASFRQVAGADCIYHGALCRSAPAQPALYTCHRAGILLPQD